MSKEEPYKDKNGIEIKEFALLKVFHFIGSRRKRHYMYKQARLIEDKEKMWWVFYHLENDDNNNWYSARCYNSGETRIINEVEIIQQKDF